MTTHHSQVGRTKKVHRYSKSIQASAVGVGGQAAHDDDNGQVKVSSRLRWRPAGSESTWILNVQHCKKCMRNLKDFLLLQQQLRKREEWKSYSFDHRCGKATSFTRHLLLVDDFTSSEGREENRGRHTTWQMENVSIQRRGMNEISFFCARASRLHHHRRPFEGFFSLAAAVRVQIAKKWDFLARARAAALLLPPVIVFLRSWKERDGAAAKRRNKISVFFMVTFKRLSRSMMGLLEINIHFSFTLLSRSTSAFSLPANENC